MKKSLLLALLSLCVTLVCYALWQNENAKVVQTDVDLTHFSSTMIYAKVFDMLQSPESYEGKRVKMHGTFGVFEYEENGTPQQSFACLIQDATACCVQGVEFTLKDSISYPQDCPEPDSAITIAGTFHHSDADGLLLVNSEFLF